MGRSRPAGAPLSAALAATAATAALLMATGCGSDPVVPAAYVAQLGTKVPGSSSMEELREAFLAALHARAAGEEPPNPNKVRKRWLPRYAVRRSAWHALDHAWEIEDRSS